VTLLAKIRGAAARARRRGDQRARGDFDDRANAWVVRMLSIPIDDVTAGGIGGRALPAHDATLERLRSSWTQARASA